jgi:hypothetical protein
MRLLTGCGLFDAGRYPFCCQVAIFAKYLDNMLLLLLISCLNRAADAKTDCDRLLRSAVFSARAVESATGIERDNLDVESFRSNALRAFQRRRGSKPAALELPG